MNANTQQQQPTPSTGVLGIDGDCEATGDRPLDAELGGWRKEGRGGEREGGGRGEREGGEREGGEREGGEREGGERGEEGGREGGREGRGTEKEVRRRKRGEGQQREVRGKREEGRRLSTLVLMVIPAAHVQSIILALPICRNTH